MAGLLPSHYRCFLLFTLRAAFNALSWILSQAVEFKAHYFENDFYVTELADTVHPCSALRVSGCFIVLGSVFSRSWDSSGRPGCTKSDRDRLSKGSRGGCTHPAAREAAPGLRGNKGSRRRFQRGWWRRRGSGRHIRSSLLSEKRVGKAGNRTTG